MGKSIKVTERNKDLVIEVKCGMCDERFITYKKKLENNKTGIVFCCVDCHNKWMKINSSGTNSPSYKKEPINCSYCGVEFYLPPCFLPKYGENRYCSKECMAKFFSENYSGENSPSWNKILVLCSYCGKEKWVNKAYKESHQMFFCDSKCYGRWLSINNVGEHHGRWSGGNIKVICEYCGKEKEIYPYLANLNSMNFCDYKCHGKWKSENIIGEKHFNWKGGKTSLAVAIRGSIEFSQHREECFVRDDFKSVLSRSSGNLVHHHLKSLSLIFRENDITLENWRDFKSILFDINNTVTLLDTEHRDFHSKYGNSCSPNDLLDYAFINNYRVDLPLIK